MPKSTNHFTNYLNHLIEYQTQLLPDRNLCSDYIILYDYLVDLLEKDDVIGEFIVRQKQQTSGINADILLDLTKLFDVRSYLRDPFLCLTLAGRDNKHFENVIHPFCNEKLSITPRNVKKRIWMALNTGIQKNGSFVRGIRGDIYELNLILNDSNDNCVRINAFCDDINLNVNLRILVKYSKNSRGEYFFSKMHQFNKDPLAKVSAQINMPFEVCLPELEDEMRLNGPHFIMVMRLIRALFKNNRKLRLLNGVLLESIIYNEFLASKASESCTIRSDKILKSVLADIMNALKTKTCPCFWNERLNVMKSFFEDEVLLSRAFHEFQNLHKKFNILRNKNALKYEEFFEFFDFKLETSLYEIDQFGIFKTY